MTDRQPNRIRIWAFHPETLDYVRLALRDGESVTLGGNYVETDEGYSRHASTYTRRGSVIERSDFDDGRDCDGRLARGWEGRWTLGGPMFQPRTEGAPLLPDFSEADAWQRDEYAEAAGY